MSQASCWWEPVLQSPAVGRLIQLAVDEDLGQVGDITTDCLFGKPDAPGGVGVVSTVRCVARRETIACGLPLAAHLLQLPEFGGTNGDSGASRGGEAAELTPNTDEGSVVAAGASLFTLRGDIRVLLRAERTILNFLMRLCGIATAAQEAVRRLPKNTQAKILDTRKTTPGWRVLEKLAVRVGGGHNHRMGLFDAVLIKDNHIAAAGGSVAAAVARARTVAPVGGTIPLQVEVDTLQQLDQALQEQPDMVLLDNFDLSRLREAVARRDAVAAHTAQPAIILEASGGITLDTLADVAATGVDRISMGALTHTVQPADLSFEVVEA